MKLIVGQSNDQPTHERASAEGGRMIYSKKQKERAIKKLARRYGEWNLFPDAVDSGKREVAMHKALWAVIKKLGLYEEYRKARKRI